LRWSALTQCQDELDLPGLLLQRPSDLHRWHALIRQFVHTPVEGVGRVPGENLPRRSGRRCAVQPLKPPDARVRLRNELLKPRRLPVHLIGEEVGKLSGIADD